VTLAMVETGRALENIDEIVAVPGLTGVYIGPGDLSLSLGLTKRLDNDEPAFLAAVDRVLAAVEARGLVAGIHANSAAYASLMIERGFHLVTVMSDTMLLGSMARQTVATVRAGMAQPA